MKQITYDISKINIPIKIYYGREDILCSETNIELLKKKLKNSEFVKYNNWGHNTFFWGKNNEIFFEDIKRYLEK